MSVKVTDNHAKIRLDTVRKASIALRFIGDDVLKRANPITPKRRGNLRRDTLVQVLGLSATIKWVKNYAVYQERGYGRGKIRNYTTPGTGPKFAEKSVKSAVDNANAQFKKAGLL
jgi:hypothetical protein